MPRNGGRANRSTRTKKVNIFSSTRATCRPARVRLTTANWLIRASTRATGICSIPNSRERFFRPIFAKCAAQGFSGSFFINWLLSREGQALFQKVISVPGDARNSRRIDVPKDHIAPDEQRRDKMNYFDTDDAETKDLTPAMKLLDEILAAKK